MALIPVGPRLIWHWDTLDTVDREANTQQNNKESPMTKCEQRRMGVPEGRTFAFSLTWTLDIGTVGCWILRRTSVANQKHGHTHSVKCGQQPAPGGAGTAFPVEGRSCPTGPRRGSAVPPADDGRARRPQLTGYTNDRAPLGNARPDTLC